MAEEMLTDSQAKLIRKNFRAHLQSKKAQPYAFTNVTRNAPEEGSAFRYIDDFNLKSIFGSNATKIFCPICKKEEQFFEGRLIWFSDGELRLIGHCCFDTNEKFREQAKIEKNRFKEEKRLEDALERLQRVAKFLGDCIAASEIFINEGAFEVHRRFRREFTDSLDFWPKAQDKIFASARERGELRIVRDATSEERLARQASFDREALRAGESGALMQEEIIWRMEGADALSSHDKKAFVDFYESARSLRDSFQTLKACGSGKKIDRAIDKVVDKVNPAKKAVYPVLAYSVFLSKRNLVGIKGWLLNPNNYFELSRVEVSDQGMSFEDTAGRSSRFAGESMPQLPNLRCLDDLQNAAVSNMKRFGR